MLFGGMTVFTNGKTYRLRFVPNVGKSIIYLTDGRKNLTTYLG